MNSDDIATVLVANGFELKSNPHRTKARAYQHPAMRYPVYVKVDGKAGALKPSTSSPFVVNEDDATRLTSHGELLDGVELSKGPYKSTGLTAYKLAGTTYTPAGRDMSIGSEGALLALLSLLLVSASTVVGSEPGAAADDQYEQLDALTPADFVQALLASADRITAAQRAMLIGHAQAPGHALSMESIALHGGYERYTAANSQYGRLGRLLADHFGIAGLDNQTQALAFSHGESDALGHFVWEMRPSLLAALQQLGWVTNESQAAATAESASSELDDEGVERAPTTRQALVNARVGQGLYREQMLDVWRQRCAVTGCALRNALVASHAQAWKDSDDTARLDPYNGLLLTASIDKLFDQGLISFANDGGLLRKLGLSDTDLAHLGLRSGARLRAECLHTRHLRYLAAHRARHGF